MVKLIIKRVLINWNKLLSVQRTYRVLNKCRSVGTGCRISFPIMTHCLENVEIGNNFSCGERLKLRTFNNWGPVNFRPSITIGDDVTIESDCHISAINSIKIGNDVLIASFVFISDHSHGTLNPHEVNLPPLQRPLYSKGPIVIEDKVWLGEKVCVLPGVTIGRGSVIGAGSVVTKSIPPYSVAVGNPAKIIRTLK